MKFLPLLGTDLSGSLAGITASHNKGGPYFRNRSIPINPSSPRQLIARIALAGLVAAWTVDLTPEQRVSWETYASNVPVIDVLGQSRNLSGQQWYIKCNSMRVSSGDLRVDDAPIIFGRATLQPVSIGTITTGEAGVATIEINYEDTDEWAIAAGGHLYVQIGQPQNPSVNFFKAPFRFAGKEDGALLPPTSPVTITSPFEIALTQKIFCRVRSTNDDVRCSAPQIVSAIAV